MRHNFTAYANYRYGSLLVTNDYGIVGGRDQEDDDSYRTRIRLWLQSPTRVNESGLRFELLQVPGIQDVVFDPRAGTFNCYVYAITTVASAALLINVQETLNSSVAYPMTALAITPDLVGITLSTTITCVSTVSQTDQQTAVRLATQAATNYINNLGIGDPLIINDISDQILNANWAFRTYVRPFTGPTRCTVVACRPSKRGAENIRFDPENAITLF